ncbi:MAG: NADPH-dependent FMN reductase [uncultured bacterium]|nr:MAG: NADPH-dependent FMN reductase [uncultured bacterium]
MRLFMFAASLRKESVNKKLINLAAKLIQKDHTIDLADFSEFHLPIYNADIQNNEGFPVEVNKFIQRMHQADAMILSLPEYNFSMPGTFKNLIDWVSRVTPMPWQKQRILLLSASPSLVGGNRGLWAARIPLESCGSLIFPDMFSLASAHEAFDEKGHLKQADLQKRLQQLLESYLILVKKLI